VSQAVFEGISYVASDRDYFYPDPANDSEWWYYKFSTEVNGSIPWHSVGDFREFLNENYYNYTHYGLGIGGPAGYGVDLCNIQIGDLVFMYETGFGWKHAVIVDQVEGNTCNASNVYVAAHTENYRRRPLSEYSGFLWYPIEIKGFLDDRYITYLPTLFNSSSGMFLNGVQNPYSAPGEIYQQPITTPNPYP
jgi:hypothetical protein